MTARNGGDRARLVDAFCADSGSASSEDRDELAAKLEELWAAARTRWPRLAVGAEEFARYLAARVELAGPIVQNLGLLQATDLFLACGCARGDPAALAAFESAYAPQLRLAVDQVSLPGVTSDEVVQQLRNRLLVAEGDAPPRISQYDGRGDLRSWLRVSAVREALMLRRKGRREIPVAEETVDRLMEADRDPELRYLKDLYRAEFGSAFQEAAAQLEARERNLLRYHYLDGLTLEQIGVLHGVHRATVARWIAAARDKLIAETQVRLRQRLEVSDSDFESLMRLVRSGLDVSVRRLFQSDPER